MPETSKQSDWTKPAAMALPKGGLFPDKVEQGRYGPIFPKTPANYGFSVMAKIIPGREEVFYEYARTIERAVAEQPDFLATLKLHYLRWLLIPIKGETYFMYQGIFDTDFDKYTEDAIALFMGAGLKYRLRKSRRIPEGLEDLGFTSNVMLPAQNLTLGFKYFSEFLNRSTFQGYSVQISGSIRF